MGKVLAVMKVMPEDAEAPLAQLKQRIQKALRGHVKIEAWEEVPIFGPLSALRMKFIVSDEAEGTEAVERLVRETPGVGEIIIEAVSLV
jgi:translation elongation factor aEF-1 beta